MTVSPTAAHAGRLGPARWGRSAVLRLQRRGVLGPRVYQRDAIEKGYSTRADGSDAASWGRDSGGEAWYQASGVRARSAGEGQAGEGSM